MTPEFWALIGVGVAVSGVGKSGLGLVSSPTEDSIKTWPVYVNE